MAVLVAKPRYNSGRTNLLCRLFGHYWEAGWYGDAPYFDVRQSGTDNVGRIHADLTFKCDRCGRSAFAGHIHINNPAIVSALAKAAS